MSTPWTSRLSTGIDRLAEAVSPRWYAGRLRDKARAKLAGEVAQSALGRPKLRDVSSDTAIVVCPRGWDPL